MKSTEPGIAPASEYYIYAPSRTAQKIFLYPIQCGRFVYEPHYTLERSSFDSFLLMYIRAGQVTVDMDGKKLRAGADRFVLLDCYRPHGYSTEEGYECLWLHFDGALARDYYDLIVSRLGSVFSVADPLPILERMHAVIRIFSENEQVREPLLSRYILDILTDFMLEVPESSPSRSETGMAEKAMTYINEHFTETVSVSQLASLSGLSPYHFIRVFRKETGYTPHEYLIQRRMASARYLLKYTSLSVKEVCYATGFSSESVFCSAFKKQHAVTPAQFRQSGTDRGAASV